MSSAFSSGPNTALPAYVEPKIPIGQCYSRVSAHHVKVKLGIESEDASLKALNMESGGAGHFLSLNNMFEYVLRNWNDHKDHDIMIVVPNMRAQVGMFNPGRGAAFAAADYPVGGTPAKVEAVSGTLGFQMMKNMSEYRVGLYAADQVFLIPAKYFVYSIYLASSALKAGLTSFLRVGHGSQHGNISIMITYKNGDFHSNEFSKDTYEVKQYIEILKELKV